MALSSCTEKSAVNHPHGLCMSFPVYDVPCRRKTSSVPLSDYLTVSTRKQFYWVGGLVTYNAYHDRKEDWLCIILHGWLRSQQLHTGI